MTKRFEPSHAICIESIKKNMHEHLDEEKSSPRPERKYPGKDKPVNHQGQYRSKQNDEKERMRKPPVSQEIIGRIKPERSYKIDIRNTL